MNNRNTTLWAAVCSLAWLAGTAAAQAQGFNLNAYRSPVMPSDGLQLASPGTLESSQWSVGVNMDYANDPLVIELQRGVTGTEYRSIVDNQLQGHLSVAYGVLNNLSVFGAFNAVLLEHGQLSPMPGTPQRVRLADGAGLGDARVGARYRILGARAHDRFGLGVQAAVVAPLAELSDKSQNFRGESSVAGDFALLGALNLGVLRIGAAAGVRLRKEILFLGSTLGNELTFGLGAAIPLMQQRVELLAEAQVNTMLDSAFSRSATPAELLLGVRASPTQNWRLNVGAGPGLMRGIGSPDFRMIAGVTFVSSVEKASEPEVTSTPAELDKDNDDILDGVDRCPTEAEDRDNFEDEDGCPEADNDRDGVDDLSDKCATEAEDKDGFEDQDGCPDADDDHDGIDDGMDACPQKSEDKDGFEDEDGCPDPDNDADGIPDGEDKCPSVRGDAAHKGCSADVSLEQGQLLISQRVEFGLASADILSSSDAILGAVKGVLETNPKLKIMVQGHTDDRGTTDNNLQLSKRRSAAVMTWLSSHGIAADRLAAWGCGESHPVAPGATPSARQQNRRVEFHVVDPPPATPLNVEGCASAQ